MRANKKATFHGHGGHGHVGRGRGVGGIVLEDGYPVIDVEGVVVTLDDGSETALFGDVLGDIANAATHPSDWVNDATKVANDAVNTVGGIVSHPADTFNAALTAASHPEDTFNASMNFMSPDAAKMLHDGTMFFRDSFTKFANSDIGKEFLSIATSAAYMGLAVTMGPAALLIFAAPGLLRGDDFTHAWLDGMFTQAERAAKTLSGGDIDINVIPPEIMGPIMSSTAGLTQGIQTATNYINSLPMGTDLTNMAYDQLAQKLQIGEDSAMLALANAKNSLADLDFFKGSTFDPKTHKLLTTPLDRPVLFNAPSAMLIARYGGKMNAAQAKGQALAGKDQIMSAARAMSVHNSSPDDYRKGFDIGTGLMYPDISMQAITGVATPASLATPNAPVPSPAGVWRPGTGASSMHGPPRAGLGGKAFRKGPATIAVVKQAEAQQAVDEMAVMRGMLNPNNSQRGFDAAVALFKGRQKVGLGGRYIPGGASAQAAYVTTQGLVGSGNPSANVGVMTTLAGAPDSRAGAAAAIAQNDTRSWIQKLIDWL